MCIQGLLFLLFILVTLHSTSQCIAEMPLEVLIQSDGLALLAQGAQEDCSICGKKKREEAYRTLNSEFKPGLVIKSNPNCYFVKDTACDTNELLTTSCKQSMIGNLDLEENKILFPRVVFRFHTKKDHLVGINENLFTSNTFASIYSKALNNAPINTELEIIEYKYGDGITYNYYLKENKLQIHCKLLRFQIIETKANNPPMIERANVSLWLK